jgi:xylulokinase
MQYRHWKYSTDKNIPETEKGHVTMTANMRKYLAGLDIGTTGCKVTVYQANGEFKAEAYREYGPMPSCQPGEIDPSVIKDCVFQVLKEVAPHCGELTGMGITSFGETAVLLDENDNPVMNSLLYTDPRGQEESELLRAHFTDERIAEITGIKASPMFTLPKLMWIRKHRPEIWSRVRKIMLIQDYITYLLSGQNDIAYSLAARTLAFDIRKLSYSRELLDFAGIDPEMLSRPIPNGAAAGFINNKLALSLGLPFGISIIAVGHDQVAAAFGASVLNPGDCALGMGTVECITPMFSGMPARADILHNGGFAVVPYRGKDTFVTYAFTFCGGALLKWYRDGIGSETARRLKEEGLNPYQHFDSRVKEEPSGLIVLPHFAGAATPYMDSCAKGAILGLTLNTTPEDIYSGLMEGVTYEMRLNLEYLMEAGIKADKITAAGGGANSSVWLQMKADILNMPITVSSLSQAGAVGSIIMAGLTCRLYYSDEEAFSKFRGASRTFLPRPEMTAKYDKLYDAYKKAYKAAKEVRP